MALPLFPPERDPGPDFVGLLRITSAQPDAPARTLDGLTPVQAPHGTTVVALRYVDGVMNDAERAMFEARLSELPDVVDHLCRWSAAAGEQARRGTPVLPRAAP